MNRGKVISGIVADRKSLSEKYQISVSVATPREYDISRTLLNWEKQGLLAKRDTARSGLMKVWINDGVPNENRLEFLQGCTVLTILNPLNLIQIKPEVSTLIELAKGTKFIGRGGMIIDTPSEFVEKEKSRVQDEQVHAAENNNNSHRPANQSRPKPDHRSYDRRFQTQTNFNQSRNQQSRPNKNPRVPSSNHQNYHQKVDGPNRFQQPIQNWNTTQSNSTNHQSNNNAQQLRAPFIAPNPSNPLNNSFNQQSNSTDQGVQYSAPYGALVQNSQVNTPVQAPAQAMNFQAQVPREYNPNKPTRYVQERDYKDIIQTNRHYDPRKGGSSKPDITIVENPKPVQQDFVYDNLPDVHASQAQANQFYLNNQNFNQNFSQNSAQNLSQNTVR